MRGQLSVHTRYEPAGVPVPGNAKDTETEDTSVRVIRKTAVSVYRSIYTSINPERSRSRISVPTEVRYYLGPSVSVVAFGLLDLMIPFVSLHVVLVLPAPYKTDPKTIYVLSFTHTYRESSSIILLLML